jgi:hypothetical protein
MAREAYSSEGTVACLLFFPTLFEQLFSKIVVALLITLKTWVQNPMLLLEMSRLEEFELQKLLEYK